MKCNPWRWLWGIPLLIMWFWITVLAERVNIQNDLTSRSQQALKVAGIDWATPLFSGRDGFVTGKTPDPALPGKATVIVQDVWGVRIANKDIDVIKIIDNYDWSAFRGEKKIRLTGFVPNEKDRQSILKFYRQRFSSFELADEMVTTPGISNRDAWLEGVMFAARQLVSLKTGAVRLRNLDFGIQGEARDFVAFKGVKAALKRLPDGLRLIRDAVTPPIAAPYTWSAKRSAVEVQLTGHVPSEVLRRAIIEYAKETFANLAIVDRMRTAAGEPTQWEQAAKVGLEQLSRLESGAVEMSDQDYSLSGDAPNKATAESIITSWKTGNPDNFSISDNLNYPEPKPDVVSPYVTELRMQGNAIEVSGYVQSEAVRTGVLRQVRDTFPELILLDRLQLGSGVPDGWNSCFLAGLEGLKKLGNGSVTIKDKNLLVIGKTKDESLSLSLPNEVRVRANRACETDVRVALDAPPEPSLEWSTIYQGSEKVFLRGQVPDVATKVALVTRAKQLFPNAEVVDTMLVAGLEPRNWPLASSVALEQLARLRKGEAIINRQDVFIRGEARDTSIATAVEERITSGLPKEYGGRHEITVRSDAQIWAEQEARKKAEADRRKAEEMARLEAERIRLENDKREVRRQEASRCEQLLRSTAAEGGIRFGWASADLSNKSHKTLDRLVEIANECPTFKIEIEGHTDAEGTPERNLKLSQRRAQSVADYLKKSGVDGGRLSAVGYGETRPVAPNDTSENRAKNRRIEFGVRVD